MNTIQRAIRAIKAPPVKRQAIIAADEAEAERIRRERGMVTAIRDLNARVIYLATVVDQLHTKLRKGRG